MATNDGVHPIRIVGHPIYSMILPIPIICFIGTVITDLTYLSMPEIMWLDFSTWLLLAGLIAGGVAGVLLVVELFRAGRARTSALVAHFALLLTAWIVGLFNSFVHARDGWTAVAGTGIILSFIGALLSIAAGWFWQSASYRRVGEVA